MKRIISMSLLVVSSVSFATPQVDRALSLLQGWESRTSVGRMSFVLSKIGPNQDPPEADLLVVMEFDGVKEREVSRPWNENEKRNGQKYTYLIRGADGDKYYEGYTLDPVSHLQANTRLYLLETRVYVSSINPRNLLCRIDGRLHSDWLKEASSKPGFSVSENLGTIKFDWQDPNGGRRMLEIAADTGKPTRRTSIGPDPDSITVEYRWIPSDRGYGSVEFRAFLTKDKTQILNHMKMIILEEEYGDVDQSAFAFAKAPEGSVFVDEVSQTLFRVAKEGRREILDPSPKTEATQEPPKTVVYQEAAPFGWLLMVGLAVVGGALLIFLKLKFGNAR